MEKFKDLNGHHQVVNIEEKTSVPKSSTLSSQHQSTSKFKQFLEKEYSKNLSDDIDNVYACQFPESKVKIFLPQPHYQRWTSVFCLGPTGSLLA